MVTTLTKMLKIFLSSSEKMQKIYKAIILIVLKTTTMNTEDEHNT